MNLDETYAFVSVARAGSFSRAGRAAGIPKSTLSRQVARLEERLGVELLSRTTRTLKLTDTGRAFYDRCRPAIETIENAQRLTASLAGQPRGTLRVTMPADIARLLGGLLPRFHDQFPGVQLEVEVTPEKTDIVAAGFDVAIRAGKLSGTGLMARKLGRSPSGFFASPAYLDQKGAPSGLADLHDHQLVSVGPPPAGVAFPFDGPGGRVEVSLKPWLYVNEFGLVLSAALAGTGIGLLLESLAREHVAAGRLSRVLPEFTLPGSSLSAIYPNTRHNDHTVRALVDFLVEHAAVFV